MKLYIDTSDAKVVHIKLDDREFTQRSKTGASQNLLKLISTSLNKIGKNINSVEEIEINTGPGSFTGLKVGLAVAQALAASLRIKINGKNPLKGEQIELIYSRI